MVSKPIDWTFFRINYFEKSSGYILVFDEFVLNLFGL